MSWKIVFENGGCTVVPDSDIVGFFERNKELISSMERIKS
jgi:hypothetical protein